MNKSFDILFKRNTDGSVQNWWAEVDDDKYRMCYGRQHGKLIETNWVLVKGKNKGKKNETSDHDQAVKEVNAIYTKKKKSGYFTDIADIDNFYRTRCMLAINYSDAKFDGKANYFSQPKLDGIRAIISVKGSFTREGNEIFSIPHINEALAPLFEKYPALILDGELYNHKLKNDFLEIQSLVRREKLSTEDFERTKKLIQYHVYDVPSIDGIFSERLDFLKEHFVNYDNIHRVDTFELTLAEFDTHYDYLLDKGYEGQMIRVNEKYQGKRSKFLIKRKEFETKEFLLLDIFSGKGTRDQIAGKAYCYDKEHNIEFSASIKGTFGYAKTLLEDKLKYIDGDVTVQFQGLSPYNVPRFPVALTFYEDKRDD